jgi:DNA-binding response OmpR family regulator
MRYLPRVSRKPPFHVLAVVLRDEGHEVVVALRGDETLEMCRLFRPDAVIADVNLSPLLIAMSGVWTNTTDRLLGETVGFDHYLVKPFDLKLVRTLLANSQGAASDNGASSA